MELELNEQEVKDILLKWAEQEFPLAFNTISIDAQYGSFRSVTFANEPTNDKAPGAA